jgi:hypothetical protein
MDPWLRFNAAARTTDAPCVTSAFSRSSSSGVHGFDIRFISTTHRTNPEGGRADPDQNSDSLLGNVWYRFDD